MYVASFTFTTRSSRLIQIAKAFDYEDIPAILPFLDFPESRGRISLVKTGFEETVHFGLDGKQSLREFGQMLPYGTVVLRFGDQNRALVPAVGAFL